MVIERESRGRENPTSILRLGKARKDIQPPTPDAPSRLPGLQSITSEQLYRGRLIPAEGLRTADIKAEQPQRVEHNERPTIQYTSRSTQQTQDEGEKPRGMYKFYQELRHRREHPQKGLGLVFDLGLETLGIPLVAIPGLQWLALLTPFIPWILTYTTGDALNLAEAGLGRTIGGKKLTPFERALYVGGALAPVIPGRVLVGLWEKAEDTLVYPLLHQKYKNKGSK